MGLESGLSEMSLGNKDQSGLLYRLHYRESCAPTCSQVQIPEKVTYWGILC